MFNLKEAINKQIKRFIDTPLERTKKHCGDLGEFIINMFVSDYSYFSNEPTTVALKEALVTEFFVRQIYWIEKKSGMTFLSQKDTVDGHIKRAFQNSVISNQLLVFNIEMAKFFIEGNQEKTKVIDERFGLLPDHVIAAFQKRIVEIKKIDNYASLIAAIGFTYKINNAQKMFDFLLKCKKISKEQGYTKK